MAIFEILYKKNKENESIIGSIVVIKHGFYLPYFFPFIVFFAATRGRCLLLGLFSIGICLLYFFMGLGVDNFFIKFALCLAFAFLVPDIKRFELLKSGYISGGCFVVKNKTKAIKEFFKVLKV